MTGEAESKRRVHADPTNPTLVNGDFEEPLMKSGDVPGWYYQRGLNWFADEKHPGQHFVEFENEVRGRPTSLLQGLALDGRAVRQVKLSAAIRLREVKVGLERTELPAVTLRFYDEKRALLGTQFLGMQRGNHDWKQESRLFKVPPETREAIVSIGLFGATGKAGFDKVSLEPVLR
jgi:protein-L-isoaspartate(D-aspartate) O-methyltransferase